MKVYEKNQAANVDEVNEKDIIYEVNGNPLRCRDKIHQQILDQSIDSKELALYI